MTVCIALRYTKDMDRPTTLDLQGLPLFGGIGAEALVHLAERCDVVQMRAGAVVFREGEPARHLFVVQEGALELLKGRDGGDVVLGDVGPGEVIGEMSFIDMQPRSATARATLPTTLWSWSYQSIHERYCADQKCAMLLVMNIARELSRRLRRADERLARLG
jgi:CRP/FNR family cyclic AMP-dependent transcriptional regulator